jgi:NAD(P)-dependent dehydrogenase (short-subunit alcohol dehydrogenase family)
MIVTGGGRETGVSHARGFAAEGAKVVIAGVLDEECRWLARELGDRALFTPLDMTNEEQWDATVHAAEQTVGPVSVLVNNAGITEFGTITRVDPTSWRHAIDVNLTGGRVPTPMRTKAQPTWRSRAPDWSPTPQRSRGSSSSSRRATRASRPPPEFPLHRREAA